MDRGAWRATIHRVAGSDTTEVCTQHGGWQSRAFAPSEVGGVTGCSSGEEVGSAPQTEGWEGTWVAWVTAWTRA